MEQAVMPIKEKIARHLLKTKNNRTIRMGIGCAWMGRGESIQDTLDTDLMLLMTSYDKGFRFYDTSQQYDHSELAVGEFLRRIPRDSIFLATKSPFQWRENHNAFTSFKDNFYRSLERLQTDHIDLFQIHDTDHFECCLHEVIPFLLEKREEGLLSYIGMGTLSLNALELGVRSGNVHSVQNYLNYSLIKKSAAALITIASQYGAAFINSSVLHFGLLKSEDPMNFNHFQYGHQFRSKVMTLKIQNKCKEMGVPILAAALQFPLLQPDIDITLNGLARTSNLDSTLSSLQVNIHSEQWAEILKLQEQDPYMYVQDNLHY